MPAVTKFVRVERLREPTSKPLIPAGAEMNDLYTEEVIIIAYQLCCEPLSYQPL